MRLLEEWPTRGVRLRTSGQILREYLVVATRPAELNGLGLAPADAIANVEGFRTRMRCLEETESTYRHLIRLVGEHECQGVVIHDANVVATALTHGIPTVVTENPGDFKRFTAHIDVVALGEADQQSGLIHSV